MDKKDRVYTLIDMIMDLERMRTSMAQEHENVVSIFSARKQANDDAKDDQKTQQQYDLDKDRDEAKKRRERQAEQRLKDNKRVTRDYRLK